MTRPIRLLLIASSLWYFSEGLLGPLFAVFSEQIGGDVLDITLAWAMYLIASGIAYLVVGRLLNRSRWKFRMIAVGYALSRFVIELTRGDRFRPVVGGFSEAQWIAERLMTEFPQ